MLTEVPRATGKHPWGSAPPEMLKTTIIDIFKNLGADGETQSNLWAPTPSNPSSIITDEIQFWRMSAIIKLQL